MLPWVQVKSEITHLGQGVEAECSYSQCSFYSRVNLSQALVNFTKLNGVNYIVEIMMPRTFAVVSWGTFWEVCTVVIAYSVGNVAEIDWTYGYCIVVHELKGDSPWCQVGRDDKRSVISRFEDSRDL